MKQRTSVLVCCFVLLLLMQTSVFAQEQGKHVLLIGIQHYGGNARSSSLRGPLNDVSISARTVIAACVIRRARRCGPVGGE